MGMSNIVSLCFRVMLYSVLSEVVPADFPQ